MIPRSWRLPILILFLEALGFIYLLRLDSEKNNDFFYSYYKNVPVIANVIDKKNERINKLINDYVSKASGSYAVYVKDLTTGREFRFNDEKIFDSASLYKLAILNEVYNQKKKGALGGEDELTASQADLDRKLLSDDELGGDDGSDKQPEGSGVVSYSVDYATQLMIRISDNYAALMLADRVGWKNAEMDLRSSGIDGFDLTGDNSPTVNAKAVGLLLEKMYFGQMVSIDASGKMIELLKDQRINDRIPKLLPAEVVVAHKTGELGKIRHDAGIVYGSKANYIVVLLSESEDPLTTVDNMALFSKDLYSELDN